RDSAAPDPRIDLLADAGILMAFDPRPELLPLGGDIGGAFGPRRRDDKEQHWYFPSGQSDAERSAKPVLQKHRIARRHRAWHGIGIDLQPAESRSVGRRMQTFCEQLDFIEVGDAARIRKACRCADGSELQPEAGRTALHAGFGVMAVVDYDDGEVLRLRDR